MVEVAQAPTVRGKHVTGSSTTPTSAKKKPTARPDGHESSLHGNGLQNLHDKSKTLHDKSKAEAATKVMDPKLGGDDPEGKIRQKGNKMQRHKGKKRPNIAAKSVGTGRSQTLDGETKAGATSLLDSARSDMNDGDASPPSSSSILSSTLMVTSSTSRESQDAHKTQSRIEKVKAQIEAMKQKLAKTNAVIHKETMIEEGRSSAPRTQSPWSFVNILTAFSCCLLVYQHGAAMQ
jgi:hypothetical protein